MQSKSVDTSNCLEKMRFNEPKWTFEMIIRNVIAYLGAPFIFLFPLMHLCLFALLFAFPKQRKALIRWSTSYHSKLIFFLFGLQMEVLGTENIDPNQNYIFVANHRSWIDVFCLLQAIQIQQERELVFMVKASLLKIPVFGQLFYLAGYIPVSRSHKKKDSGKNHAKLDIAVDRCRSGANLLIFPEGTRSLTHKMGAFKNGAANISLGSGTSILPISLSGVGPLFPKGRMFVKKGRIRLEFLSPIEPELGQIASEMSQNMKQKIAENYYIDINKSPAKKDLTTLSCVLGK